MEEGTYNDPANTVLNATLNTRVIPSFLFDDGDLSEEIFNYIEHPIYDVPADLLVSNWTETCSDPEAIFGSLSVIGPFVGCLLYANITRDIANGSLVTNITDSTFVSDASETISLNLRSTYTTCLSGYCASQNECAASNVCDVGNLLTSGYELSAQGVVKCWLKLCTPSVQEANPDIAGVGVCYSSVSRLSEMAC
jgi:hypothetical protein